MSGEFKTLRMADLDPVEAYELLTGAIVPRPIVFVSTCNLEGIPNLAPFSFFTAGGSNPPSVIYSSTVRADGTEKDSLRNILEVGEFVVNSIQREMTQGMLASRVEFLSEESPLGEPGFTPVPSVAVRPPRVAESLVQLECRLHEVVRHGNGPGAARYVIGEVLVAHLEATVADDISRLRTISRLGGRVYADLAAMEIFHPK